MNREQMRRLRLPGADEILADLTMRQHLRPHTPASAAIDVSAEKLGYCRNAAGRALGWLAVDASVPIGRLTRTQLAQLSRCLYRFCRQALLQVAAEAVEA